MDIYSIGHSNRTLEDFVSMLRGFEIQRLMDVRTLPRSAHNPQFNRETLPQMLKNIGIKYTHLPELGGLRHARADSPNKGWKNVSFRGYADYMQTPEFEQALKVLMESGKEEKIAYMCAEAVPWRCHRSLISDALAIRGIKVHHIMSRVSAPTHRMTPWAKILGTQITYPDVQLSFPAPACRQAGS